MSWQLAKFINPSMSVYRRFVWVKDLPELWETKEDVRLDGSTKAGRTSVGFATNVLGDGDNIPMVASLDDIELISLFAVNVRSLTFNQWKALTNDRIEQLSE